MVGTVTDVAGEIADVGYGVNNLKPGDKVVSLLNTLVSLTPFPTCGTVQLSGVWMWYASLHYFVLAKVQRQTFNSKCLDDLKIWTLLQRTQHAACVQFCWIFWTEQPNIDHKLNQNLLIRLGDTCPVSQKFHLGGRHNSLERKDPSPQWRWGVGSVVKLVIPQSTWFFYWYFDYQSGRSTM